LEKSGFSKNSTPFPALGNRQAATTMISRRMNKTGIIIFDAFSIPPRTPWIITK
jgi:hypothetical protein